jgi:hypothetical protein
MNATVEMVTPLLVRAFALRWAFRKGNGVRSENG